MAFRRKVIGWESYASNMVLDDINTMKDIVSFAEINRYRGTLLADMSESEKTRCHSAYPRKFIRTESPSNSLCGEG